GVEGSRGAQEADPASLGDRRWELVSANKASMVLVEGVDPDLLEPVCNVLRASLHPRGLAPRIINIAQWSAHVIDVVQRQIAVTGDDELQELERELIGYADEMGLSIPAVAEASRSIATPLRLRTESG